jgi:hypothetical protein
VGQGEGQVVSSAVGTLRKRRQCSQFETSAEFVRSESARVTHQKLRRGLQAISGEPRLGEHVTLDVPWHRLRISSGRVRFAAVQVIGPETLQSHVRPPSVVPAFEFRAQGGEMVKALEEGHAA